MTLDRWPRCVFDGANASRGWVGSASPAAAGSLPTLRARLSTWAFRLCRAFSALQIHILEDYQ